MNLDIESKRGLKRILEKNLQQVVMPVTERKLIFGVVNDLEKEIVSEQAYRMFSDMPYLVKRQAA